MSARSLPYPSGDELQRAHALMKQGDLQTAEQLYRQLLDRGVENAALLSNLGVICWQNGNYGEMEQLLRRALQLEPRNADSHYNLALVLAQRGNGGEAIHHYRQALPLASSQLVGSIHWNLAKLLLRQGEYAEGWQHYEWRRRKAQPLPPICQPGMAPWPGGPVADGELVLVGEQGLGDMIQFLRYAPAMAAFAPRVSLVLPEKLHGLVRCSALPVQLLSPAEGRAQRHGAWLPLLSAPGHLGVSSERVLVDAPYLQVPVERVQHWRRRLRAGMGRRERLIGLNWQGNPATETSELRGRSLPLQSLAPLAQLPGLRFVSLQKGAGSEQLPGSALAPRLVTCQAEVDRCWDFVETGAIALACDLLITCDTALTHLAGALGVTTWLLLHHTSDWRWGEAGDTTFWYRSMRLFRQQSTGGWSGVITAVATALVDPAPALPTLEQRALQLLQQNLLAEAEVLYRQLLREGSTRAAVVSNLGAICAATGRLDEAVPLLEQALQRDPNHVSALANLGAAYCQKGAWAQAEPLLRRALALNPRHLQALNRLRHLLSRTDRSKEAIDLARRAVALAPQSPEAHYNLGVELKAAGALTEARESYEQTLVLRPDDPNAQSNLAMILLLQGDYGRGLELREARLRKANPVRPIVQPPLPRWRPGAMEPTPGPLLVVGEQGLGDMLQFLRYVNALPQAAEEVWLCLPDKLVELARLSGLKATVYSPEALAEPSDRQPDCWVPLLSLPWHLGVTPQQPLVREPYLRTDPRRQRHWQQRLHAAAMEAGHRRPVVALHWQGNIETGNLVGRSLPLEALAPLATVREVALLSLQKGYGSEQLQVCSFCDRFLSCQAEVDACWDFVDTAAIVLACDLLITSDSALAHLAGGLGVPTWLLLHHPPDWRWGLEGETTFWYPTMRLFRQQRPADWDSVIARVHRELQGWLASWSPGE